MNLGAIPRGGIKSIIMKREGEYPTSLWACIQHFTGVMTFVMIFTRLSSRLNYGHVAEHHVL